jgi:hypothetical protein
MIDRTRKETSVQIMKTNLFAVALIALAPQFASAQEEQEVRVRMKDLPAPVQRTVKEQSQGAALRGLSKEIKDGRTFYEAELRVAGHTRDVLIDIDGRVVEIEEQVALNALPPAVRSEIVRRAGKGRILLVESITIDGAIVAYEAHIKTAGKISELKVGPDGKPLAP